MDKALMDELVAKFRESYDVLGKDGIWQQHSATFRRFWSEKVLSQGAGPIPEDECDVVIRILDRNGKGNTKGCEAVARTMASQVSLRRLLNALHTDQRLAMLVDSAFKEKDLDRKAALIDDLYKANEGNTKTSWSCHVDHIA